MSKEAKFTPGLWGWVNGENDNPWNGSAVELPAASLRTIEQFPQAGLCFTLPVFVIDFAEGLDYMDEESKANAHLIAAAPDGHSLGEMVTDICGNPKGVSESDQDRLYEAALSFIKRCRGES